MISNNISEGRYDAWFFLILVLSLATRIFNYHHILVSDEANNMLTIKAIVENFTFTDYFFKHPPLFILFSSLISYPFGDNHYIVQGISITFSVLSIIPFYMITERVFDKRTALFSILFLSVLPVNIIYSTWVKQDPMLLFFFLWGIYLYITGRYFKSGFVFGIASLVKEFAWFMVPIVASWEFLNRTDGRSATKRVFYWFITGAAVSGWWYLSFGRPSYDVITAAIRGENLFEFQWHHPWYYYFRNMPGDLTIIFLAFFIIGFFSTGKGIKLFPVFWFSSLYLPLSILTVKAPWYTYLASPAICIIVAAGFINTLDFVVTKRFRLFIIIGVSGIVLYNLNNLHPVLFYESQMNLTGRKLPVFNDKEYLLSRREILKGEQKVGLLEYNPTLQYYLGISANRVFYLGPQFPAMRMDTVEKLADENGIGWFAIDTNSAKYLDRNIEYLISLCGEPKKIGSVLIFKYR